MTEVHRVFATVAPNQVTVGFYTLTDGNLMTMVHPNGDPVMLDEAPVTAKLSPGSNNNLIEQVARLLTKKIRKSFRGELVEGFDRVIAYPSDGSVV